MLAPALFTFGYEGLSAEDFIDRLRQVGVDMIVDVRELPLSRKRGFSKTVLRGHLAAAGIAYEHHRCLGCPKPVRDRYKSDGDWAAYTGGFMTHLVGVQAELRTLAATARRHKVCLVCFEADHETCHRTYVARAARRLGAPAVQHLTARTVIPDVPASLAA